MVSTFFTHFDEDIDGFIRSYRGWARWSGTSFAAPKVAAAIAQDMYLHGGSARAAWERLSAVATVRYPDLGIVFNWSDRVCSEPRFVSPQPAKFAGIGDTNLGATQTPQTSAVSAGALSYEPWRLARNAAGSSSSVSLE